MTGAVNRDFWTCGSFADFVARAALFEVQILWQAQQSVNLDAQISWQPHEPRSAYFVAGAALCEPRMDRGRQPVEESS